MQDDPETARIKAIMQRMEDMLDAMTEYTQLEKSNAVAHLAIANMAMMGCSAKQIRSGIDLIIESNPALSMEAVAGIQAGRS